MVLSHQEMSSSPSEELVHFKINCLECDLVQQTYNTNVTVRLGEIGCKQSHENDSIKVIDSPLNAKDGEYLFVVKFSQVDKKSPEFHSKHKSCEALLSLQFTSLNVILHQEALHSILKFATELQLQVDDILNTSSKVRNAMNAVASVERTRRLSSITETVVSNVKQSRSGINFCF